MNNQETIYSKQRREGYERVLAEIKADNGKHTPFENAIKEKLFHWWAKWVPDYEGWLKIADWLYAPECVMDAIGDTNQIYKDYRAAMKHQRDAYSMDMGPIDNCVVEGDTVAISYNMYLTAKADMGNCKQGTTYKIKVTEFNKFAYVDGNDNEPMVVSLLLTATTPGC